MTVYVEIPGFRGYFVSRTGEVKNSCGNLLKAKSRQLLLRVNGKQVGVSRASLVLRAFVRPPNEGECALHYDDNQQNNDLSNLRWGTRTENHADAIRNGKLNPQATTASMWKNEKFKRRSANRRHKHKGAYFGKPNGARISEAWENGAYAHVDWSACARRGHNTRKG